VSIHGHVRAAARVDRLSSPPAPTALSAQSRDPACFDTNLQGRPRPCQFREERDGCHLIASSKVAVLPGDVLFGTHDGLVIPHDLNLASSQHLVALARSGAIKTAAGHDPPAAGR